MKNMKFSQLNSTQLNSTQLNSTSAGFRVPALAGTMKEKNKKVILTFYEMAFNQLKTTKVPISEKLANKNTIF